jgi:purine-binding chemotaxis protein CheW
MATTQVTPLAGQYLTFRIGGDAYGIRLHQLRELIEMGAVTRVPSTPPWIRGVTNLRGTVLPVIDLAVKFGLPETTVTRWTCIVVVEAAVANEKNAMGVIVDSVHDVLELTAGEVEPPPPFGTRVRVEFVLGMGRAADGFVVLLDIDKVLSTDELLAVSALEEGSETRSAAAREEGREGR